MDIYEEKHIDLDKMLTINFTGATIPLVDSGDKLGIQRNGTSCEKLYLLKHHPFWGTGIRYKQDWLEIDALKFRPTLKKYHHITINMDPSKLTYSSELKDQRFWVFDVIKHYQSKIKYLALVYEYGKGKLHWHMLINIQSIKEFQKDLEKVFGTLPAVVVKKVTPNKDELLEDNLKRILNYFKKEDHNKETLLLSKY